jgi:uncharacterized protein
MATGTATDNVYKNSRYNIYYSKDGHGHIFNTRTCGLLKIPVAQEQFAKSIAGKVQRQVNLSGLDEQFTKMLEDGGYIVPGNLDELELIKFQKTVILSRSSEYCSIVVVPTLNCNMACGYCFEHKKNSTAMSKETQKLLIDHVKYKLASGCKSLSIEWFGGEPLLCFPIIKSLSVKFMALCKKYKAEYSASMITNGTLLTEKIANNLKRLKVLGLQVTLDGPPVIHDKRRPFRGGGGTFEKILANTIAASKYLNISIRCNVDTENLKHAEEFVDRLAAANLPRNVRVYFSPVRASLDGCLHKRCTKMLSEKNFALLEPSLTEMIKRKNFAITKLIDPFFNGCSVTYPNSFMVGPEGQLYKCNEHLGQPEEVVGNLKGGFNLNNILFKWINFSPTAEAKCRNCKVLPMCMGWCPARVRNDKGKKFCFRLKYNLIEHLKLSHNEHKHLINQ